MKTGTRRFIVYVLCAAIVYAAVLSSLFIAHAIDHDCAGENCAVCACIRAAEQQLEQLGKAGVKAACAAAVLLWYALVCHISVQGAPAVSPVKAKVRMND